MAMKRSLRARWFGASITKRGSYIAGITFSNALILYGSSLLPNSSSSYARQLVWVAFQLRLPLRSCSLLMYIHKDLSTAVVVGAFGGVVVPRTVGLCGWVGVCAFRAWFCSVSVDFFPYFSVTSAICFARLSFVGSSFGFGATTVFCGIDLAFSKAT